MYLISMLLQVMKFLEMDVSDLLPFGVYMFRVMAVNAQGEGEALMSIMPCIAKHAIDPPLQPATPRLAPWSTYIQAFFLISHKKTFINISS